MRIDSPKIVNITWHDIRVDYYYGEWLTIKANKWYRIALPQRTKRDWVARYWTNGEVNLYSTKYNNPKALLDFYAPVKEWIIYATSWIVCKNYPNRWDLYIPYKLHKIDWVQYCRGLEQNPFHTALLLNK